MHKFFILIHLLHSSTCFEHCCAHLQEDNCISTASGIGTLSGWIQYTGYERTGWNSNQSSRNLCTEQSYKDSDDTRCCTNTIVLLKISTVVLEKKTIIILVKCHCCKLTERGSLPHLWLFLGRLLQQPAAWASWLLCNDSVSASDLTASD